MSADPDPERLDGESGDLAWDPAGPRSRRFDDVYFSAEDGLAESRAVFLQGCGLPDAWRRLTRFTVAELGFGTGLNIAALLELWRRARPPGARLSIFSVEAFPLTREAAARALQRWPEVGEAAAALLAAWPDGRRGLHRIDLPGFGAVLDLYVGEVEAALAAWSGPADAWFLDGFAPSRNPAMWSDPVLDAVGRLSAPGARVASFTVAGAVRRGLVHVGFEVAKRPGFGAKRERLEARRAGERQLTRLHKSVVVIGGGIAGAALVRAFSREGLACNLVEAQAPGAGASGNPAALVTPRLDAGLGPSAVLHAQAFARAAALYRAETPGAVIAQGALQLPLSPRDPDRFSRVAAWDGFAPGSLRLLEESDLAAALDDAGLAPTLALAYRDALVVEPAVVLASWLAPAGRVAGEVAAISRDGDGWTCLDKGGGVLARGDLVCIAAGHASGALAGVRLQPVRGQAEFTSAPVWSGAAAAWGAYAIPTRDGGVLFGASHRRGDADDAVRPQEADANLQDLGVGRPALAARVAALAPGSIQSRAAIRAATHDHMPMAGALPALPGVFVLTGLGGRGYTLAPLLAEHIAALALGAPSPLDVEIARRVRPDRFDAENRSAS